MKLEQLTEAKYAEDQNPQFTGLTVEQFVKKFFEYEEELSSEGHSKHFYPKDGLLVQDSDGDNIQWLIRTEEEHASGPGNWVAIDHQSDRSWTVDPTKLIVFQAKLLYK